MSSFEKEEEQPCERQMKTSDLDEKDQEQGNIRMSSLNLLALPVPVLMETLRKLSREDRMSLSHTNQRLRNMIMRNTTSSMDRRKQIPMCSFEWRGKYTGNYVNFPGDHRSRLDADCSFVEHVQRFTSLFDCEQIFVNFIPWRRPTDTNEMISHTNFPEVVEAFGGQTKLFVSSRDSSAESMRSLFDYFMKYRQFCRLQFNQSLIVHWPEYCNTVTQLCTDNGTVVKRGKGWKYGLEKQNDEEGKEVIKIFDCFGSGL